MLKSSKWIDQKGGYIYEFAEFDFLNKTGVLIITEVDSNKTIKSRYWAAHDKIRFIEEEYKAELTYHSYNPTLNMNNIDPKPSVVLFEDELETLVMFGSTDLLPSK